MSKEPKIPLLHGDGTAERKVIAAELSRIEDMHILALKDLQRKGWTGQDIPFQRVASLMADFARSYADRGDRPAPTDPTAWGDPASMLSERNPADFMINNSHLVDQARKENQAEESPPPAERAAPVDNPCEDRGRDDGNR